MAILKIGSVDRGKKANISNLLGVLHQAMPNFPESRTKFRESNRWYDVNELSGNEVEKLQSFLHTAGFMPLNAPTGIFDYVTLSATRLFQEYVRTINGDASIGKPDGVVGPKTWSFINAWPAGKVCEWWAAASQPASQEHSTWIGVLNKVKQHHLTHPHPVIEAVKNYPQKSDTLKIQDWNFDPKEIHFVGIRRDQDSSKDGGRGSKGGRINDDIFFLLINGLVFKFWGSTDPSTKKSSSRREAFLVEGQHIYRYGWHMISNAKKTYKALRPATNGVLVFRDQDRDKKLSDADIAKGLDKPNPTINIHWSGMGSANRSTWSAGCQVIVGDSYVNNLNQVVDCKAFAGYNYDSLAQGKTRGAYNFLLDLVLAYAPVGKQTLLYTLGRDDALDLFRGEGQGRVYADALLKSMQ
ncbi:MAG: peptidoglycan-binding protein [Bacteroidia bacterium]